MADERSPSAPAPSEADFESAVKRLEQIVGRLERGEAPLDEGIALFTEGMELARRCNELLAGAEERIQRLIGEGERLSLEPFRPAGGEEEV